MKKKAVIRIFLLICTIGYNSQSFSQEMRSFQIWNLNSFSGNLSKKALLVFSEKIHYAISQRELDLIYGEVQFKHRVNSFISYGTGFRVVQKNTLSGWSNESRPMLNVSFQKILKSFKLGLNSRLEYRFIQTEKDHFRNVERLDIDSPSFSSMKLSFFLSGEVFTKLNSENLHLVRYYAGFRAFEYRHFNLRVYYALARGREFKVRHTTDICGVNFALAL